MSGQRFREVFEEYRRQVRQSTIARTMIPRTKDEPGIDLLEDAEDEVGGGGVIHGHNDYAAMRASEKGSHPGGGVRAPKHDAIAFANLARAEFAGKTVSGIGDIAVSGADYAIAVGLGEGGFPAEAREVRQVIGDARSLHLASVTHLAAWVNR